MLQFDSDLHEYRFGGINVPGVTSVLAPLVDYSMVNQELLERARVLGQAVHLATELYDQGTLDTDSLDPVLVPYLDAWIRFRKEVDFQPIGIEQRVYHPIYRYAGTLDRTGLVRGNMAVLDIKKMLVLGPVIGVQLAAYQNALNVVRPSVETPYPVRIADRYALGLQADGTYRLQQYQDPADWSTFLSLLNIKNWKAKHNK